MIVDPNAKTLDAPLACSVAIARGAPARLIAEISKPAFALSGPQAACLKSVRSVLGRKMPCALHGRVGVGKSIIGAWIVRQCAVHRKVGRMHTVAGLMQSQKNWFNTPNTQRPSPIENAISAYFLVLDELVAEQGSLYDNTQIEQILKERYDAQRPTLIITNIVGSRLHEVVANPIYDRIRDGGIIELKGTSMRGKTG